MDVINLLTLAYGIAMLINIALIARGENTGRYEIDDHDKKSLIVIFSVRTIGLVLMATDILSPMLSAMITMACLLDLVIFIPASVAEMWRQNFKESDE